jgi:hypothetical protein
VLGGIVGEVKSGDILADWAKYRWLFMFNYIWRVTRTWLGAEGARVTMEAETAWTSVQVNVAYF